MMGGYKQLASFTVVELMVQISIRKRVSAFVEMRDDFETKIGRLLQRLNMLITKLELWQQKFVSFEEHTETHGRANDSVGLSSLLHKKEELNLSELFVFPPPNQPYPSPLDRVC